MKKTKKLLALLVVLAVSVSALAACGNGAEETTTAKPAETTTEAGAEETTTEAGAEETTTEGEAEGEVTAIKLASHNAEIEGNPYRVRYEQDIQEAAEAALEYGLDVTYASFVSNWDPATETQQIQNSINEGYDVILVNPVASTGLDPVITKAQEAGIIYINADVEYLSEDVNVLNICTDQYYLGAKSAEMAAEVLGEGAKIVAVNAIDGNSANDAREQGFDDVAAELGLEIISKHNHNWSNTEAQQVMTEVLNSGAEFDGVFTSQCAEGILAAYDASGQDWPGWIGFGDTGEYMQRMLEINAEEEVLPFLALSNPPGVGASALNFGLNEFLGKTLRDDIEYGNELYHSIYLPSKIWFDYNTMEDHREMVEGMDPGDTITYWLTIDEVAEQFFN